VLDIRKSSPDPRTRDDFNNALSRLVNPSAIHYNSNSRADLSGQGVNVGTASDEAWLKPDGADEFLRDMLFKLVGGPVHTILCVTRGRTGQRILRPWILCRTVMLAKGQTGAARRIGLRKRGCGWLAPPGKEITETATITVLDMCTGCHS